MTWSDVQAMPALDQRVLRDCLNATVRGPFFDDREFASLLGFERGALQAMEEGWLTYDFGGDHSALAHALTSCMNNLLRYPHGHDDAWPQFISAPPETVQRLLNVVKERSRAK